MILHPEKTSPARKGVQRYQAIREVSLKLAAPLSAEDCAIQSMPDASPVKWHLAHTTWFFETFVLRACSPGYSGPPGYAYLFNSYYDSVGPRLARDARGMISRPTVDEVYGYRARVEEGVLAVLEQTDRLDDDLFARVELWLHHEQQHQ